MSGTCSNCRFWVPVFQDDENGRPGHCRRHAPELLDDFIAAFPLTYDYVWCGEYQSRRRS